MSLFKKIFPYYKSKKDFDIELFKALYKPNKQKVIKLIKNNKIEINDYLVSSNSILINAVNCSSEYHSSDEQINIIKHLIDQKTNINWKNENGYNALHIALSYHSLSKISLLLIRKGNPDINAIEEKHGNSPIFIAIREYGLTWREDQKEINQLRFEIISELLSRGADLDMKNHHGISTRTWIEKIPKEDKLHKLINDFDKKNSENLKEQFLIGNYDFSFDHETTILEINGNHIVDLTIKANEYIFEQLCKQEDFEFNYGLHPPEFYSREVNLDKNGQIIINENNHFDYEAALYFMDHNYLNITLSINNEWIVIVGWTFINGNKYPIKINKKY